MDRIHGIVGQIELFKKVFPEESLTSLADIGSDHAKVGQLVLEKKYVDHVIITDIHKGPLENAKKNINRAGYSSHAGFVLTDGLHHVDQTHGIVIAGMGGILMERILREGQSKVEMCKLLILQPMRDSELVRGYLGERLLWNDYIYDGDKWYEILVASGIRTAPAFKKKLKDCMNTEDQLFYHILGRIIPRESMGAYEKYIQHKIVKIRSILGQLSKAHDSKERILGYNKDIETYTKILKCIAECTNEEVGARR